MENKLEKNKTNEYLLETLKKYFKDKTEIIVDKILNTPVPQQTLINCEKIVSNVKNYNIDEKYIDYIVFIAAYSPFLTNIVRKNPDYFLDFLFKNENFKQESDSKTYFSSLETFCAEINTIDKIKKYLRYFKQREFLRIGLQDIAKIYPIETITKQLSELAESFLRFASEWLIKHIYKKIELKDFFILGMGKLAGMELNFSSDIDLIYIYNSESNVDKYIYQNFFETLTKLINEITGDGFVFRVDLRLRPEGDNGPIAVDENSALFYYENFGRFWERGVLLKARPVAGNIDNGIKFLKSIEPFIYRRNLDFQIVEEIKNMKNKINISIKQNETDLNIKLGYGGIREIEFVIQSIQLVFGGKYPEIRERNSILFLNKIMTEFEFLEKEDIKFLIDAYRFLRSLEHKIQILHEKQTHNIPTNPDELKIIASYFGYKNVNDFLIFQNDIRKKVHNIFTEFFELKVKRETKVHKILALIEQGEINKAISYFNEMKIKAPKNLYNAIFQFLDSLNESISDNVFEIFSEVFNLIDKFDNKDIIIIQFMDLINNIKYSKGYLTFLIKNPTVIESLMNIFDKSSYLSKSILKYKELFEEIFFSDLFKKIKSEHDFQDELKIYLEKSMDYENRIEQIRVFRHKENLRIGLHFLNNDLDVIDAVKQLSDLAIVILKESIKIVKKEFEKRYGKIDNRFTIIGLGKFGGKELNFSSDLDIILLFEKENYSEKGFSANEYFSRFLQRLISFLSIRTHNGILYEIDTRLRPSGNAGALVTSFNAFKSYHDKSSAVWEVQALLKSSIMGGDYDFGKKVMGFMHNFIMNKKLTKEDIDEILRIRKRIEIEEGHENEKIIDIKSGAGGIIDIEFLVQILLLQNKLVENNTFNAIKTLKEFSILEEKESELLFNSYKFLRRIENLIRLTDEKHNDKIYLEKIESSPVKNYIDDIIRTKSGIRKIFNNLSKGI